MKTSASSEPSTGKRKITQATSIEVDDLQCPVCRDTFTGNILLCSVGHSVCAACYQVLPAPTLCPECTANYFSDPDRNITLESVLSNINTILPCSFSGCGYLGKPAELVLHRQQCALRQLRCSYIFGGTGDLKLTAQTFRQLFPGIVEKLVSILAHCEEFPCLEACLRCPSLSESGRRDREFPRRLPTGTSRKSCCVFAPRFQIWGLKYQVL